jgi:hypothetical protein
MPDNAVSLTATYKDLPPATYTVTITNGTGSGDYAKGATVSISAGAAPTGQEFDQWTGDISLLSSATATATSFTMPASVVNLTATYKDVSSPTYTVKVVNGTGGGEYEEAAEVNITADGAPSGQEFSHWSGDNQYLDDSTLTTATLTVPAMDVTITAVYSDIVSEIAESSRQVIVYPNPASDKIKIHSTQPITSIKLLDMTGTVILQQSVEANDASVNVADFAKGIYFMQIATNNKGLTTRKLVIQ